MELEQFDGAGGSPSALRKEAIPAMRPSRTAHSTRPSVRPIASRHLPGQSAPSSGNPSG